ncbi:P-II family nitrogen regulator [Jeotgalibacillus campisalis]|uniref:Nitrogen regulatory protein P-II n=1 Tax=Jeotgalibacillus campisalis TaxID=220754 RepID=A0A0C2RDV3_9BACL|nr:P-II family nitrogen regulator [Jeotgalibacillus campisalis]KIL48445.1 nitrogen regulatory protein P-II [Jeotgalibacillus campisalis]
MNLNHKLFVAVLKRGSSRSFIRAAKKAGLDGATVLYGYRKGKNEKSSFLGVKLDHKKDIVLAAYDGNLENQILSAGIGATDLETPGNGSIGFVIHLSKLLGVPHLKDRANQEGAFRVKEDNKQYQLIITIVNSGESESVIQAAARAGAEGCTILSGRGTGVNERQTFMKFSIDPEKDVILTIVPGSITDQVIEEINEEIQLDQAGKGISFLVDVEKVFGVNHSSMDD